MNEPPIDADEPEDELHTLAHPQRNVAERIERLLARCDKLKRASALRPVLFDDDALTIDSLTPDLLDRQKACEGEQLSQDDSPMTANT
jgi:hypothetical protein